MMNEICEDALGALAKRLGLPLEFREGDCVLNVGDQPFMIRHDEACDRLVVSALVADDLPPELSRSLVCDLLNLGFGMMENGYPAVGRDPETGFIAAFAFFPLATLVAVEFPDAFVKFTEFATVLADRLDAERAGGGAADDGASSRAADDFAHGVNALYPGEFIRV